MRRLSAIFALVILTAGMICGCRGGRTVMPVERPLAVSMDEVRVGGELHERIMCNFDRLEEEYYQPDQVFWSEDESGGWPGDKEGRTILALTLASRITGREALYLDEMIRRVPLSVNELGYFGTVWEGVMNEQQLSGHGWLLRGLCEYYDWTGDESVLAVIRDVVDNLFLPGKGFYAAYPLDPTVRDSTVGDMSGSTQGTLDGWMLSSDVGCVFIGMEGLIHAYRYLPSPELKEVIDEMIASFLAMDLKGIKAQTHASLTAMRGLLRYADITGDLTLVREVADRWKTYLSDGMTENFENYNWFDRFDTWTEPCAVVDSYMVAMQLWQMTGDVSYLHDAEGIYYNGLCHAQRHNGGFGCDNCPGEHDPVLRIHAQEAYWCCTMRGGEGLAKVGQYSLYTGGDTIVIPTYRDLAASFTDSEGVRRTLGQRTGYPFEGWVEFRIGGDIPEDEVPGLADACRDAGHFAGDASVLAAAEFPAHGDGGVAGSSREAASTDEEIGEPGVQSVDNPAAVALKIHLPSWTDSHRLTVNSEPVKIDADGGFLVVGGLTDGDKVRLEFDMEERHIEVGNTRHASQSQYRLMRGPLQIGESHGQKTYVYHLMDPAVSGEDYGKKILFE